MTEEEWLRTNSVTGPLVWMWQSRVKADRKFRLFAAACVRQLQARWGLDAGGAVFGPADLAERLADGLTTPEEEQAFVYRRRSHDLRRTLGRLPAVQAARETADKSLTDVWYNLGEATGREAQATQMGLLRCVFGNPFRPVALADSHRTPTVVSLARAAYDERQLPSGELDPHRLAVLADALEEAGAAAELVEHLRSPGPHVRGCFAVDPCLGLS